MVLGLLLMDIAAMGYLASPNSLANVTWQQVWVVAPVALLAVGMTVWLSLVSDNRARRDEAQARERVREAEDKLSEELRRGSKVMTFEGVVPARDDDGAPGNCDDEPAAPRNVITGATTGSVIQSRDVHGGITIGQRDDGLTLAALWDVTHGRMDLYHQIVTGQAKRSFIAAQVAMGIGFVLLVVFAVLAAEAKTTAAAIGAGGLGAVGAAFAAYIGKTFIRSQESAASHLRAYFDQPLELSRYLAAERLLADAKELTAEQRTAILSTLVQSIATAGQNDDKARETKPGGRQSKGRGLH